MAPKIHACTGTYEGRSSVLKSLVTIGVAFDPLHSPVPAQTKFDAIWDTGASASVISPRVVQACSLQPTGVTKVFTASGEDMVNTYLISVLLPNELGFPSIRVSEGKLTGGDMLIGMDLISCGDFAVSNFEGKTVFTYRCPSIRKTDYVDEFNRSQIIGIGRNDPCHCGSGKKFKKCCGAA